MEPKVILILTPYLLEPAADMVAVEIVVEGVFEFGNEVLTDMVGGGAGGADAFAIEHRDGEAVKDVLLAEIKAGLVVGSIEPAALQFG